MVRVALPRAIDRLILGMETNLDLWARWVAWLDTYVKNPKQEGIAIMNEDR